MKRLTITPTYQTFKSVTDDLESLQSDTPVPAERVDRISDDDGFPLSPLLLGPHMTRLSAPKERKNLDDAWKNIKMEQDEKYADDFRNDMLLTRFWEIWRQGFQWIMVSVLMMQNEDGQNLAIFI